MNMLYPKDSGAIDMITMSMRGRIEPWAYTEYNTVGILECRRLGWPGIIRCNGALLTYPELDIVEELWVERTSDLPPWSPWGPTIVPVALEVIELLRPDLVVVTEHGMCHSQRMGPATHVGIHSQLPTIGISRNTVGVVVGDDVVMDEIRVPMTMECARISIDLDLNLPLLSRIYPCVVGRIVGPYCVSIGNMITLDSATTIVSNILRDNPDILEA